MTTDDHMKEVREFYENYSQLSTKAWELHQEFYREFGERQTEVFSAINDERLESLKQLPEIETPTQLFEMGIKLEESARAHLIQLQKDTNSALEKHYSELAALYAPEKPARAKRTKTAA